jgi:hypothetical protein
MTNNTRSVSGSHQDIVIGNVLGTIAGEDALQRFVPDHGPSRAYHSHQRWSTHIPTLDNDPHAVIRGPLGEPIEVFAVDEQIVQVLGDAEFGEARANGRPEPGDGNYRLAIALRVIHLPPRWLVGNRVGVLRDIGIFGVVPSKLKLSVMRPRMSRGSSPTAECGTSSPAIDRSQTLHNQRTKTPSITP